MEYLMVSSLKVFRTHTMDSNVVNVSLNMFLKRVKIIFKILKLRK